MRFNFFSINDDVLNPLNMTSEIVVLTGIPGSGKSKLATTMFQGYTRINLDTLKSRSRERAAILSALENSENVVIDNTDTTTKARKRYIELGKARGLKIRSIYVKISLQDAISRNERRTGKEKVPTHVVRFYFKMLEPPSLAEGFDSCEIIEQSEFDLKK